MQKNQFENLSILLFLKECFRIRVIHYQYGAVKRENWGFQGFSTEWMLKGTSDKCEIGSRTLVGLQYQSLWAESLERRLSCGLIKSLSEKVSVKKVFFVSENHNFSANQLYTWKLQIIKKMKSKSKCTFFFFERWHFLWKWRMVNPKRYICFIIDMFFVNRLKIWIWVINAQIKYG